MGVEIERKFLVAGDFPRDEGVEVVQGYLSHEADRTVRVRVMGANAFLTIKGQVSGISRPEFEYKIPLADARVLLGMIVGSEVSKTRYYHRTGRHCWEIDVFTGVNEGLVVAEIELSSEDEPFEVPDWLGEEVTGDARYMNAALSMTPFCDW